MLSLILICKVNMKVVEIPFRSISFLPEASFGLRLLSLPASVYVCVCVCLSVCQSLASPRDNTGPVRARITKFRPKMQQTLVNVVNWSTLIFTVKLNLKVQIYPILASLRHNSPFIEVKLGSPILDQSCKIPWLSSLFFYFYFYFIFIYLFIFFFFLGGGAHLTLTFKVKYDLKSKIFRFYPTGKT